MKEGLQHCNRGTTLEWSVGKLGGAAGGRGLNQFNSRETPPLILMQFFVYYNICSVRIGVLYYL